MTRFVTLNQFVNEWECDENDHMNVQFYYAKFDDAGQLFAACHGLEGSIGKRLSRHVRYHSELRGGAQLRILSSFVNRANSEQPRGCMIQHVMEEVGSGKLAATALDWHEECPDGVPETVLDNLKAEASPRGISSQADLTPRRPKGDAGRIISRGVLNPSLCDAKGFARDQAYIGAGSDAASHSWNSIGIDTAWLEERSFGRVAVEMRLIIHTPMPAGSLYEMELSLTSLQSRAFCKRYDFFDVRAGTHFASLETAAMMLNHKTRRSEPLPDFAREAVQKVMV